MISALKQDRERLFFEVEKLRRNMVSSFQVEREEVIKQVYDEKKKFEQFEKARIFNRDKKSVEFENQGE